MTWYHGTSEENYRSILASWFEPQEGTWGKGVYFSSSKEGALLFGDHVLKAIIPEEHINYLDYEKWITEHPDESTWPEELKKLELKAVAIRYASGETELCVFDLDAIGRILY